MKIISLTGSPRKNGNSISAAGRAMDFFKKEGHNTEGYDIRKLKISPCIGCGKCKTQDTCVIKDDFITLIEKIQESDIFLLTAPIYFGRVPGPVKNFIDRCYSLFDENMQTRVKKGKKCLFITVSHAPAESFAGEVDYLEKWFVGFMKFESAEKLAIGKCADEGDLEVRENELKKIDEVCKRLIP